MRNHLSFARALVVALIAALGIWPAAVQAQSQGPQTSPLSRVAGVYSAYGYGQWEAQVVSGNPATGAGSIIVCPGIVTLGDGRVLPLASVAPFSPILVDFGVANGETVTPTAVTISASSLCGSPAATITATFSNIHGRSARVISGTFGLQDAINDATANGGGEVVVERAWQIAGGTNVMLAASLIPSLPPVSALIPGGVTYIRDTRGGGNGPYWAARPGLTAIAAPTALVAATYTTATTGGTIATGAAVRACVSYVDQFGGESICSTDSGGGAVVTTGAGATNSVTVYPAGNLIAASTGAVGYRVYLSAAAGASLSENFSPPGAANSCTASTLTPILACAMTSTAVINVLPGGTAAGPPLTASGHTTAVVTPMSTVPFMAPFVNSAPAGFFAVTRTSSAVPIAMGELPYMAGMFNAVGKCYHAAFGGVVTPSAATVAGTWSIALGPRNSSTTVAVNGASIAFTASQQWTAVLENWNYQVDFCVTALGASGTVESHNGQFQVTINSTGLAAAANAVVGDVSTAASSAIDLTQQGNIQLIYLHSAASWTLPQVRYFTITPTN